MAFPLLLPYSRITPGVIVRLAVFLVHAHHHPIVDWRRNRWNGLRKGVNGHV